MTYEPRKFREAGKDVVSARDWAVRLVAAVLGIGFLFAELQRILALPANNLKYAHLALLAVVIGLVFLWFWATDKELSLLLDWLDPVSYLIPISVGEVLTIIGFGILLVVLVFAARDPLWFSVAFSVYSLALIYAAKYMNSQIGTAIQRSRLRAEADLNLPEYAERATIFLSALDVLDFYFLKRPSIRRLNIIFAFSVAGLAFATCWTFNGIELLALLTYGIFIVLILVSESIVGSWRIDRDRKIKAIYERLREIERDQVARRGT